MRHPVMLAVAAAGLIGATPALAHGGHPRMLPHWGGPFGAWYGVWQEPTVIETAPLPPAPEGPSPQNREEWLRECRHRLGDNGLGGAVIGGVVGGVAGHALAGHGDKVLGTVAGAAVGAIAGAAIDKAEDAPRVRDRCEAMLDGWGPGAGYVGYGAPYGYAVPVMLVPVSMMAVPAGPAARGPCKETVVTEEIVTAVPRRSRLIPPRARPDKRIPQ